MGKQRIGTSEWVFARAELKELSPLTCAQDAEPALHWPPPPLKCAMPKPALRGRVGWVR
jgi:hypothetical protein